MSEEEVRSEAKANLDKAAELVPESQQASWILYRKEVEHDGDDADYASMTPSEILEDFNLWNDYR